MEYFILAIKLLVGLSILNVWLLRAGKPSQWRGGNSGSLAEEFESYGLNKGIMYLVGFVKVALALALIASIWIDGIEEYAALGIAIMMLGAVSMHVKISDPLKKSFPAFSFLVLSLIIYIL